MSIETIFIAALGLIVGSFLNVVICRHGTGRSIGGRSGCLSCGKTLQPLELVPLFSWLLLRGRCRRCDAKVSAQYPLVELGGALAFSLAYLAHPFLSVSAHQVAEAAAFAFAAAALSSLVAIVAYDLRHKIIPDTFSAFLAVAALGRILALGLAYGVPASGWAMALVAGPGMALPLYLLWAVSRGRWMGLGDPKLALGLGWLVGLSGAAVALFLSFVIGALLGGGAVLWNRLRRRRGGLGLTSEIPFAPYLALGAAIVFLSGWGVPDLLDAVARISAPVLDPLVEPIVFRVYGL